jgi:hypothetical protein
VVECIKVYFTIIGVKQGIKTKNQPKLITDDINLKSMNIEGLIISSVAIGANSIL